MARETRILCDRCTQPCAAGAYAEVSVQVDVVTDAAGSPDTVHEMVELCTSCLASELASGLSTYSFMTRAAWVDRVRKIGAARG